MKKVLRVGLVIVGVIVIGAIFFGIWFYTTIPDTPSPPTSFALEDTTNVELNATRAELQIVREQIQEAIRENGTEGIDNVLHLLKLSILENRVDEKNTARLKKLVAEHGWLHEGRVGEKGAEAAFIIAQHADHDTDFQKKILKHIQKAYEEENATGQQVALLTDRLRVAEGKPQLYGTQAQFNNGELQFHPIKDSTNIDQRRANMGLPPLSEYAEKLSEEVLQ
jgi:hypothetical protein